MGNSLQALETGMCWVTMMLKAYRLGNNRAPRVPLCHRQPKSRSNFLRQVTKLNLQLAKVLSRAILHLFLTITLTPKTNTMVLHIILAMECLSPSSNIRQCSSQVPQVLDQPLLRQRSKLRTLRRNQTPTARVCTASNILQLHMMSLGISNTPNSTSTTIHRLQAAGCPPAITVNINSSYMELHKGCRASWVSDKTQDLQLDLQSVNVRGADLRKLHINRTCPIRL